VQLTEENKCWCHNIASCVTVATEIQADTKKRSSPKIE